MAKKKNNNKTRGKKTTTTTKITNGKAKPEEDTNIDTAVIPNRDTSKNDTALIIHSPMQDKESSTEKVAQGMDPSTTTKTTRLRIETNGRTYPVAFRTKGNADASQKCQADNTESTKTVSSTETDQDPTKEDATTTQDSLQIESIYDPNKNLTTKLDDTSPLSSNPTTVRKEIDQTCKTVNPSINQGAKDGDVAEESSPVKADGNVQEDSDAWNLVKVFSVAEILGSEAVICSTETCSLKAAVVYVPSDKPRDPWYMCVDCQEDDFGGWDDEEMRNHTIDVEQERVFRTHCSARHGITIPSETNKGEGDVLLKPKEEAPLGDKIEEEEEEEEAAEAWDLVKILSAAEVSGSCPVVCQTEGCRLKAGLIYMSSSGEKWYGCLDCQDAEFGGWPEAKEMADYTVTKDLAKALRKHCSKNPMLVMPAISMRKTEFMSPAPNSGKNGCINNVSNLVTPLVTELEANMPTKNTSKAALDMHKKWQEQANSMGGPNARIVVEKRKAKKLIFDMLHDAFAPMNITQIHKLLKAIVPSPVLKTCLEDMSYDADKDKALFADSDDEGESTSKTTVAKKQASTDQFAGALFFKAGRNPNNSLYYVDYTKQPNQGNGLEPKAKNELYTETAKADNQMQTLQQQIRGMRAETIKLLSEPTNEEITRLLDTEQAKIDQWLKKTEDARQYQANAKDKEQLKRRLQQMTGEWRKRRRICLEFLTNMEEMSDGTIRRSKCLAGDGAIEIESDEMFAKNVLAYHKKKQKSIPINKKLKTSTSLSDDAFIAVRLDSQGCVERIYAGAE